MTETRTAGHYVREARNRAKMSQVELEASSGVSQSVLSRVETGRGALSVRSATCLELALGLPPRALVRWAEDLPANLRASISAIPG